MNWTDNPKTWMYWLAGSIIGAVIVGFTVMALISSHHDGQQAPAQEPVQQSSTFTWEGVTWDCNQVNQWNQQYGSYEPDGTPIPYEVTLNCGQR